MTIMCYNTISWYVLIKIKGLTVDEFVVFILLITILLRKEKHLFYNK